jgi:pimeloyl-ACP methyl ester carboxylesterase
MIQDLILSGLVDHYRVVCFDWPGFGYSQRPRTRIWTATTQATLFAKALHQLGVRNPVVFGHSWGTLVAIALAMQNDYTVRGSCLRPATIFRPFGWTSGSCQVRPGLPARRFNPTLRFRINTQPRNLFEEDLAPRA